MADSDSTTDTGTNTNTEEVLTQEEIDALLTSVEEDENNGQTAEDSGTIVQIGRAHV